MLYIHAIIYYFRRPWWYLYHHICNKTKLAIPPAKAITATKTYDILVDCIWFVDIEFKLFEDDDDEDDDHGIQENHEVEEDDVDVVKWAFDAFYFHSKMVFFFLTTLLIL